MSKPKFSLSKALDKEVEISDLIAPKMEIKQETVEVETSVPESVFTHEALTILRNQQYGGWDVAVIKYDPVTRKTSSTLEVIHHSQYDKLSAWEKFRIEAATRVLDKVQS